jgi:hypothetical protein
MTLSGRIDGFIPAGRPPRTWISHVREDVLYVIGIAWGVWDRQQLVVTVQRYECLDKVQSQGGRDAHVVPRLERRDWYHHD